MTPWHLCWTTELAYRPNRLSLNTGCFMYRVSNGMVPDPTADLLTGVHEVSQRDTRQSQDFHVLLFWSRQVVGPSLTREQYYEEGYQIILNCSQVCPALKRPTRVVCSWSRIHCENKVFQPSCCTCLKLADDYQLSETLSMCSITILWISYYFLWCVILVF